MVAAVWTTARVEGRRYGSGKMCQHGHAARIFLPPLPARCVRCSATMPLAGARLRRCALNDGNIPRDDVSQYLGADVRERGLTATW